MQLEDVPVNVSGIRDRRERKGGTLIGVFAARGEVGKGGDSPGTVAITNYSWQSRERQKFTGKNYTSGGGKSKGRFC